tara:strand:- start:101 stop:355 length:255 start_codon:yes stop_codon:yes gene_type:complete
MQVSGLWWKCTSLINSTLEITLFGETMANKTNQSGTESNLLSPINNIRFWNKGEMAYSALKKINELKAINELDKAKIILAEWFL